MNFFFDIIEQFDINTLIKLVKESPFYVVENVLVLALILLIMHFFTTRGVYGFYSFFFRGFSKLVLNNLAEKFSGNSLFFSVNSVFFYILFLYILIQNLLGLVPEALTITAFLLLPAHISFMFFGTAFLVAVYNCGFQLPKAFVPFGIPSAIAPFLAVIEFISYFIRLFSLSIRLFINLLAGHLLFKIFSINLYDLIEFLYNSFPSEMIGTIVIYFYFFLEVAAAILQAIVLTSLTAIYLNESAGLLKNF